MPRQVAGHRDDYAGQSDNPRGYPVTGPLTFHQAIDRVMELCGCPRWQAIAAVNIAIVHRANSEPCPGGLITIRVVPGGFTIEERNTRR